MSEQAAANLLPALDADLKPKHVLLLATQKMRVNSNTEHLKAVLLKSGVRKVELMFIENELDAQSMVAQFERWLVDHASDRILLNLTGGTKLMTLAIYECVRSQLHDRMDVVYLDVDTQNAIYLQPATQAARALKTKLSLGNYLEAYGYVLHAQQPFVSNKDSDYFCNWMLSNVNRLALELGEFNQCCNDLDRASKQNKPLLGFFDAGNEIVQQCVLNKWLIQTGQDQFEAVNIDALRFMQGGWLEYAVAHSVKQLQGSGKIQDAALNAQVMTDGKTKNELDCAFIAKNRLHLIECKTRNFSRKDSAVAQESLYKLDSLVKLGGLRTKGLLVSFRTVPQTDMRRAKDLGIEVIQREQLATLTNRLSSWLSR